MHWFCNKGHNTIFKSEDRVVDLEKLPQRLEKVKKLGNEKFSFPRSSTSIYSEEAFRT